MLEARDGSYVNQIILTASISPPRAEIVNISGIYFWCSWLRVLLVWLGIADDASESEKQLNDWLMAIERHLSKAGVDERQRSAYSEQLRNPTTRDIVIEGLKVLTCCPKYQFFPYTVRRLVFTRGTSSCASGKRFCTTLCERYCFTRPKQHLSCRSVPRLIISRKEDF